MAIHKGKLISEAHLTHDELDALDAVAEHVDDYLRKRVDYVRNGITLAGHVLSCMIDKGQVSGHSFTGNTLDQHSASLQSAIDKLEAGLPTTSNPLEPIEDGSIELYQPDDGDYSEPIEDGLRELL